MWITRKQMNEIIERELERERRKHQNEMLDKELENSRLKTLLAMGEIKIALLELNNSISNRGRLLERMEGVNIYGKDER